MKYSCIENLDKSKTLCYGKGQIKSWSTMTENLVFILNNNIMSSVIEILHIHSSLLHTNTYYDIPFCYESFPGLTWLRYVYGKSLEWTEWPMINTPCRWVSNQLFENGYSHGDTFEWPFRWLIWYDIIIPSLIWFPKSWLKLASVLINFVSRKQRVRLDFFINTNRWKHIDIHNRSTDVFSIILLPSEHTRHFARNWKKFNAFYFQFYFTAFCFYQSQW